MPEKKPTTNQQRQMIEDLVRIESEVAKLLPLEFDAMLRPAAANGWSPSELGLHIVLTLEDCAARFESARTQSNAENPGPTWTQKLAQSSVLATFRYPGGRLAEPHLIPKVMLDRQTILHRLISSRETLLDLEKKLHPADTHRFVVHPILGPLQFYSWIRLLLIHALHHKRLSQKGL